MITWKNMDTLASYAELQKAEKPHFGAVQQMLSSPTLICKLVTYWGDDGKKDQITKQ